MALIITREEQTESQQNAEAKELKDPPDPNATLKQLSLSINFDDDEEEEDSDNSYDHLDHHRSLNDFASNYCQ